MKLDVDFYVSQILLKEAARFCCFFCEIYAERYSDENAFKRLGIRPCRSVQNYITFDN